LKEAVVNDTTSGNPDAIATWNGYSADGDVTGELVYVNYGRYEDYQAIANVNLTGKIVIVRYGQIFRGQKAKFAQERGAIGVLIFMDPGEDGYLKGPVYPNGPWASNTTVQRGTVWTGNGDPGTPGFASAFGGPRIDYEQAQQADNEFGDSLPQIPIQPIGVEDVYPLLTALGGNPLPDPSWATGLNLSFIGPGPAVVHLKVEANFTVTPIWNVIGRIQGAEEPDRVVIYGGHRDAWTMGAGDPISGTSVIVEVARGFGELLKKGWKPRRTILICSWDAEEFGLIGSTEFVETYIKTLSATAVAYLNVDIAVSGTDYFGAGGSPSMASVLREVTAQITLPNSTNTVASIWQPAELGILGSGSDFTSFIQHVGISAMDFGIGSFDGRYSAVYHSNYDSFYWYTHFGDPTFEYHGIMAKVFGLTGLRFADDPILPFNFVEYASAVQTYIQAIQNYTTNVDFSLLNSAASNFSDAAQKVSAEIQNATNLSPLALRALNDRLMLTERAFLGDPVESGREWYLHVIFAPSTFDSYAGQAFPAIWYSMMNQDWNQTEFISQRIALVIDHAAKYLEGKLWKL